MTDTINVGSSANDHTGDPLRTALIKVNAKFAEQGADYVARDTALQLDLEAQIAAFMATVNYRGQWLTATAYSATARDYVLQGGLYYLATISHTAGTFATDLAALKWVQLDATALFAALASTGSGQGSAMVAHLSQGTGAVATTLQAKLRHYKSAQDQGVVGDNTNDDTAEFQAALNTGGNITLHSGYAVKISDWLTLMDNQTVTIEPGARINQVTADKGVFKATNKTNAKVVNNGILHGPGVYSPAWTGNSAHSERGVYFINCTNSGLLGEGTTRNFGHAQVGIVGGSNIKVRGKLEGTHTHGMAILSGNNFQMGVYLADDAAIGGCSGIDIDCDISGSTQGIVRENLTATGLNSGPLKIRGHIHDIPGQHGVYIQNGNLDAIFTSANTALSACKLSSPAAGMNLSNFQCSVVGENIGSHLFEVDVESTGSLSNLKLVGTGKTIGGAALAMLSKVSGVDAELIVSDARLGFQTQGANQTDVTVRINGKNITQDGVAIYATASDYKIYPVLKECNSGNDAFSCGIRVESVGANVTLIDPNVTDANTRQRIGLFNSIVGSNVKVRGSAVFTGAATYGVRATGVITDWPSDAVVSGASGAYLSLGNIYSNQPMVMKGQSTTGSNVLLWYQTMPDESVTRVSVELVGRLSGTAQRRSVTLNAMFYRDGGICTIQGAVTETANLASGAFAGVYSLASSGGNDIYLLVNSGGVATYDWTARVVTAAVA